MGTTGQYFQRRRLFLFGKSVGNCTKFLLSDFAGAVRCNAALGLVYWRKENLASAQPAPPPENFMRVNEKRLWMAAGMIAIDSVSYEEKPMSDFLETYFKNKGLEVYRDQAGEKFGGNGSNILSPHPGTMEAICFNAHQDTVEPGPASSGGQRRLPGLQWGHHFGR